MNLEPKQDYQFFLPKGTDVSAINANKGHIWKNYLNLQVTVETFDLNKQASLTGITTQGFFTVEIVGDSIATNENNVLILSDNIVITKEVMSYNLVFSQVPSYKNIKLKLISTTDNVLVKVSYEEFPFYEVNP